MKQLHASTNEIRAVFMGSPDFAIPALRALSKVKTLNDKKFNIVGVVTQPDKPVGRKQTLTPPPVKIFAEDLGLSIFQPAKLRTEESIKLFKDLSPDIIVVVAYGKIIPKEIIEIPKFGVLNIHGSLLPKYRGASPIQFAILEGEIETGISIMLIDEEMDHGPILAQEKIDITPNETSESLSEKLSALGADLLIKVLPKWASGEIKTTEQKHDEATFTKILTKEDGKIDWALPVEKIERQIRAFYPWPGTWTIWNHNNQTSRINVIKTKTVNDFPDSNYKNGQVFKTATGFAVKTGNRSLEILKLQLEGKREIESKEFLNGHPEILDSIFI